MNYVGWLDYQVDPLSNRAAHMAQLATTAARLRADLGGNFQVRRSGSTPLVTIESRDGTVPSSPSVHMVQVAAESASALPPLCFSNVNPDPDTGGPLSNHDNCGTRAQYAQSQGLTGDGASMAILEWEGVDDSYFTADSIRDPSLPLSYHYTIDAQIAQSAAPDAELHIANSNFDLGPAFAWANSRAEIVNISIGLGVDSSAQGPQQISMGAYTALVDWFVRTGGDAGEPPVLVTLPVGNIPQSGDWPGNSAYNALIVGSATPSGSAQDRDSYTMMPYMGGLMTAWQNPDQPLINGGYSPMELPHLVVPADVSSFAAPLAAGAIAVGKGELRDAAAAAGHWNPSALRLLPEVARAAALASADCDVDGIPRSTTDSSQDTQDGAGLLNVTRFVEMAHLYEPGGGGTTVAPGIFTIGEAGSIGGNLDFESSFHDPTPCADLLTEDIADLLGVNGEDCAVGKPGIQGTVPESGEVNVALAWLGGASCPDGWDGWGSCDRSYPDAEMMLVVYEPAQLDALGEPLPGEQPLAQSFHRAGTNEYVHFELDPEKEYVALFVDLPASVRTSSTRVGLGAVDGSCMVDPGV